MEVLQGIKQIFSRTHASAAFSRLLGREKRAEEGTCDRARGFRYRKGIEESRGWYHQAERGALAQASAETGMDCSQPTHYWLPLLTACTSLVTIAHKPRTIGYHCS
jgi:hypothetical protein